MVSEWNHLLKSAPLLATLVVGSCWAAEASTSSLAQPAPLASPQAQLENPGDLVIKKVTVIGDDQPQPERQLILGRYINQVVTGETLFALARDVTNHYVDLGFATTRVVIVPRNVRDGEIQLEVRWGRVKGWLIDGQPLESAYDRRLVESAMPGRVGQILNVLAIDQAVENLRSSGQDLSVRIVAADEEGESYLDVRGLKRHAVSFTGGVDNSGAGGSTGRGKWRRNLALSVSNVVGLNDSLELTSSTRRLDAENPGGDTNTGVSFGFPIGPVRGELRLGRSEYRRVLFDERTERESSGDTESESFRLVTTIDRERTHKQTLFASIARRKQQNYFEGIRIAVNSGISDEIALGYSITGALAEGTGQAELQLINGRTKFGNSSAGTGIRFDSTRLGMSGGWERRFQVLERPLVYNVRFGAQYARESLLPASRLTLGDEYTVRGFKTGSVEGDSGFFVSNNVSAPLPLDLLGGGLVTLFGGIDLGAVKAKASASKSIAGAAFGLRLNFRNVGLALTVAAPILHREYVRSRPDVYISGSFSL